MTAKIYLYLQKYLTILDELLFESGYDRQIRPQIEGPPLEVMYRLDLLHMNSESIKSILIEVFFVLGNLIYWFVG